MDLEVGLDGFVLPSGLRTGQRFTFELRRFTWPVVEIDDFSDLPIPFTAVAVDLESGDRVLLESGNLATAMRASMSIPGIFTPAEVDGRLMVDGGIIANLPIDVVREMGADIVIAIDISDPMVGRDELTSLFAVTSQAMTISSRQNTRALLSDADLVLAPEVSSYGTLEFKRPPRSSRLAEPQRGRLRRNSRHTLSTKSSTRPLSRPSEKQPSKALKLPPSGSRGSSMSMNALFVGL